LEVVVFSTILQRFMEKSPVPVIVQVLLERVLSPEKLNKRVATSYMVSSRLARPLVPMTRKDCSRIFGLCVADY